MFEVVVLWKNLSFPLTQFLSGWDSILLYYVPVHCSIHISFNDGSVPIVEKQPHIMIFSFLYFTVGVVFLGSSVQPLYFFIDFLIFVLLIYPSLPKCSIFVLSNQNMLFKQRERWLGWISYFIAYCHLCNCCLCCFHVILQLFSCDRWFLSYNFSVSTLWNLAWYACQLFHLHIFKPIVLTRRFKITPIALSLFPFKGCLKIPFPEEFLLIPLPTTVIIDCIWQQLF